MTTAWSVRLNNEAVLLSDLQANFVYNNTNEMPLKITRDIFYVNPPMATTIKFKENFLLGKNTTITLSENPERKPNPRGKNTYPTKTNTETST